jgi:hypothetical protein
MSSDERKFFNFFLEVINFLNSLLKIFRSKQFAILHHTEIIVKPTRGDYVRELNPLPGCSNKLVPNAAMERATRIELATFSLGS